MDDSIYRLRHRDILALCVLGLLALGIVMVQSASMSVTGQTHWQWTARASKHLLYAMVALATFFAVGQIHYAALGRSNAPLWRHPIVLIFGAAAASCLLVLVPHVGLTLNGARRWLPLGPVVLQPSELAKWSTVIFLAWWLSARPLKLERFIGGFVSPLFSMSARFLFFLCLELCPA